MNLVVWIFKFGWLSFFKDIQGISKVKNQEEFLDNIKDIKIRKIFQNNNSLFELENNLNKFYLENLYKTIKRCKQ
jgi:vacuolar-type H+-ATPase subunit C/Vma6